VGGRCDSHFLALCRQVKLSFRTRTEPTDTLLSAIAGDR
jgi:hypothetical protein